MDTKIEVKTKESPKNPESRPASSEKKSEKSHHHRHHRESNHHKSSSKDKDREKERSKDKDRKRRRIASDSEDDDKRKVPSSTEKLYKSHDKTTTNNHQDKENVKGTSIVEALKPLEINGSGTPAQLPSPSLINHPNIYLTYGKFVPDTTEVKKQEVFIKKEYLPAPPKILIKEKTRDDVTRTLNFGQTTSSQVLTNGSTNGHTNESSSSSSSTNILIKHETPKIEEIKKEPEELPATEIKSNGKMSEKDRKDSSKHKSSSSSSHHKSSHRSSSSRKDCSRCYKRSKIKRANIGIQCRRDKTSSSTTTTTSDPIFSTPTPQNRIPVVNRDTNCVRTGLETLKYGKFFRIEVHPNGGASFVHLYQDEINSLAPHEMDELVAEFFKVVFSEDQNGFANHIMGIVHDAAAYIPDLLEHMAENYANLTVKAGVLGRNNDIETCTMHEYNEHVIKNYGHGTIRYGPLHQISIVGKVHEEVGGYFPDLIARIEKNPFLYQTMPWGNLSILKMDPRLSNDGPILWIRPGEQLIPTAELSKTPLKRQR